MSIDDPPYSAPPPQGDQRTYSYAVGISSVSDPDWQDLLYFARLIPRVCHNINR